MVFLIGFVWREIFVGVFKGRIGFFRIFLVWRGGDILYWVILYLVNRVFKFLCSELVRRSEGLDTVSFFVSF